MSSLCVFREVLSRCCDYLIGRARWSLVVCSRLSGELLRVLWYLMAYFECDVYNQLRVLDRFRSGLCRFSLLVCPVALAIRVLVGFKSEYGGSGMLSTRFLLCRFAGSPRQALEINNAWCRVLRSVAFRFCAIDCLWFSPGS